MIDMCIWRSWLVWTTGAWNPVEPNTWSQSSSSLPLYRSHWCAGKLWVWEV